MNLRKTIRLLLTFYRGFFLLNLIITLACLFLFYEYRFPIFVVLFWFKLVTLGLVFYFINLYKHKEFYYYYNLGLSKAFLWSITLSFDFLLYLFLLNRLNKFV